VAGAFAAIESELVKVSDAEGLAAAYTRQIGRLAATGDVGEQPEILRRLARIQSQALSDPASAIATLEKLLDLQPKDVSASLELAALQEAADNHGQATQLLETVVALDPSRVDVFRSLLRLFTLASDVDRSYCACSALVAMGEADLDEQLIFAQHRPENLPIAKATLNDETWQQLLPESHPRILDGLAIAIEKVAFDAWYENETRTSLPPIGKK